MYFMLVMLVTLSLTSVSRVLLECWLLCVILGAVRDDEPFAFVQLLGVDGCTHNSVQRGILRTVRCDDAREFPHPLLLCVPTAWRCLLTADAHNKFLLTGSNNDVHVTVITAQICR